MNTFVRTVLVTSSGRHGLGLALPGSHLGSARVSKRAGTSPVNAVVRESILERQAHWKAATRQPTVKEGQRQGCERSMDHSDTA